MDRITLFSNGMAHFEREFSFEKEELGLKLPFKSEHIGDIATSLSVFGDVTFVKPPAFTPTNNLKTALFLDTENVWASLLQKMSGTKVAITIGEVVDNYTLVGTHKRKSTNQNGAQEEEIYVVIRSESGEIFQKNLNGISSLKFLDEAVQREIDHALTLKAQMVNPESTFLELTLKPNKNGERVTIAYTIPVSAWKMRYNIRNEKNSHVLDGAVVVDNNTDEDWKEITLNVVTGSPISFQTDIASISIPERQTVNLVDQYAVGCASDGFGNNQNIRRSVPVAAFNCGVESMPFVAPMGGMSKQRATKTADFNPMEIQEVGDFCVLTAPQPITIESKKSAIIPMFSLKLQNADSVLLFKQNGDQKRPYRALKFTNEADHDLGKGKLVIYQDGILSGESILETTKPKEVRVIPYCLDNSVQVTATASERTYTTRSLKLSAGVGLVELEAAAITTFHVTNIKNLPLNLSLEMVAQLFGGTRTVVINEQEVNNDDFKTEMISNNGYRFTFNLVESPTYEIVVTEKKMITKRTELGDNIGWLSEQVSNQPSLMEDENVKTCLDLQQKLDDLAYSRSRLSEQLSKLNVQAERIRENIQSTTGVNTAAEQVTQWVRDLDNYDKKAREIEDKTLVDNEKEMESVRSQLIQSIRDLNVSWN